MKKTKPTRTERAARPWIMTAKAGELEILLYEMIGQDFWTGEGTTAKQFAEDLKAAGKISKIHLRVNSPGGSVFDGLAIYNTLLSHGAKVTAQVDGLAASIASVIIMAASEISMGDNAMLMIHNPWTSVQGDSNDMRKMAETMDKVKVSMVTAYRRHTTKTVDEVGAIMDEETWMTADEAVSEGFAEKVTKPEEADLAANFDLSRFHNVPAEIAAKFGRVRGAGYCACACLDCTKGNCEDCDMENCKDAACKSADCPMQEASARAAAKNISGCGCPCLPCNQAKCKDCTNDTCGDPICKENGCPEQKASSAAGPCGCACLPCNQADCKGCTDDVCDDPVCKLKGCPNQKESSASLRSRLKLETSRANTAETSLATERQERATGAAGEGKWLTRVHGGLDQAGKIFTDLWNSLTSRQQTIAAGRAASKSVEAGLAEIGTVLNQEKSARTAEMNALERIGSDAEKATAGLAAVQTGLVLVVANPDRFKALEETLGTIAKAFAEEQTARASETAAVKRIGADIQQASEMFAAVQVELGRRQHPAMAEAAVERLKGLEEKLASSIALLALEKTARASDGDWVGAMSAEIALSIASLTEEIAREKAARAAADGERIAHAGDTVGKALEAFTAVQAATTEFATIHAAVVASNSHTKRVDGENLTSECFLWVGDPEKTETWALPWRFSSEEKTESHLRDALARFDQEEKIPASEKPAVHAKLVRLCKEHGITVSDKDAKAAALRYEAAAGTDPFQGLEDKIGELQGFVAWEKQWQGQEVTWLESVTALVLKVATAPAIELAGALDAVHKAVTARRETVAGSLDARMKPLEEKLAAVTDVMAIGKVTLAANAERMELKLAQLPAAATREKALLANVECFQSTGGALIDNAATALAAVRTEISVNLVFPGTVIDKAAAEMVAVHAKVKAHAGAVISVDRLKAVEDTITAFSAAITEERNVRSGEVAWPKRMSAELEQSASAFKGAIEELWRRNFAGEAAAERLQKLGEKLIAIGALVFEEKNARVDDTARAKLVSGEVEQLTVALKGVRAELAHRQYPASASITRVEGLEEKLAAIAAAVLEETADRKAADVDALNGMAAKVKEATTALEAASEELGRRARLASL